MDIARLTRNASQRRVDVIRQTFATESIGMLNSAISYPSGPAGVSGPAEKLRSLTKLWVVNRIATPTNRVLMIKRRTTNMRRRWS